MTNYADIDELKKTIYFRAASLDDRYLWEQVPDDELADMDINDGFDRYRMLGCAHREADRDGVLCTHCGEAVVQLVAEPPKKRAPRRRKK